MILLTKYDAFRWHEKLGSYSKGYFYEKSETNQSIIEKMHKFRSFDEFNRFFKSLNGEFAACIETDSLIYAVSDYTRTFPLYYAEIKDDFVVSDSPDAILKLVKTRTLDPLAMKEFKLAGFSFSSRTLYKEIKTLGSGEALIYNKKTRKLTVKEYMEFSKPSWTDQPVEELIAELNEVYDRVVENSLGPLRDRTIVFPMGSSWWQRLLLHKIKDLGLRKVILYSYGSKTNPEVDRARDLASYFGYPWYMVEYTGIDWFKWYNGKKYKAYKNYSSHYNAVPYIKENMAIKDMIDKRAIPEDAVFINTCFTGFMRGDLISKVLLYPEKIREENLKVEVLREIASNFKWKMPDYNAQDDFIQDIFSMLEEDGFDDKPYTWYFKYAYWKEVVGKYLSNSRRVYEFYGHQWRNIQVERHILDFWAKVPPRLRYRGIIQHAFDKKYNKDILDELSMEASPLRPLDGLDLKDYFRIYLPGAYRRMDFRRRSSKLKDSYDLDPLLWYNIISRREFNTLRTEVSNILGVLSIKYIWSFLKSNNYDRGGL